jgi:hypothetical protein
MMTAPAGGVAVRRTRRSNPKPAIGIGAAVLIGTMGGNSAARFRRVRIMHPRGVAESVMEGLRGTSEARNVPYRLESHSGPDYAAAFILRIRP